MTGKRLTKSRSSKVFGVAAGLAEYLNIDPTVVRVLFVLLALMGGSGVALYVILAIIMPYPEMPLYGNQQPQDTSYVEVDSEGNAIRNEPQTGANNQAMPSESATAAKVIAAAIGLAFICVGCVLLTRQLLPCAAIKVVTAIILMIAGLALAAVSLKRR